MSNGVSQLDAGRLLLRRKLIGGTNHKIFELRVEIYEPRYRGGLDRSRCQQVTRF